MLNDEEGEEDSASCLDFGLMTRSTEALGMASISGQLVKLETFYVEGNM
jgi:hypothetical protein